MKMAMQNLRCYTDKVWLLSLHPMNQTAMTKQKEKRVTACFLFFIIMACVHESETKT